jgi:hypothetical protein
VDSDRGSGSSSGQPRRPRCPVLQPPRHRPQCPAGAGRGGPQPPLPRDGWTAQVGFARLRWSSGQVNAARGERLSGLPWVPSEGAPTSVQTLRLPPPDPGQMCSSCLIALHLRKWSPRSDSNRRRSDYGSDRNPPSGPAQNRLGCSGARTDFIRGRPVLAGRNVWVARDVATPSSSGSSLLALGSAIESTFSSVRLRTRMTEGPAPRPRARHGLQTAGAAQDRWRARSMALPGRAGARWGPLRQGGDDRADVTP